MTNSIAGGIIKKKPEGPKAARLLNCLLHLCYFSMAKNPFGWKSAPVTFFEMPF